MIRISKSQVADLKPILYFATFTCLVLSTSQSIFFAMCWELKKWDGENKICQNEFAEKVQAGLCSGVEQNSPTEGQVYLKSGKIVSLLEVMVSESPHQIFKNSYRNSTKYSCWENAWQMMIEQ